MEKMVSDLKTTLVTGSSGYTGAVPVDKLLKAGHKVKASEAFIYRKDNSPGATCMSTICNTNLTEIKGNFSDVDKLKNIISGCSVVIYLAKEYNQQDYKTDYEEFVSLVNTSKICTIRRFIFVSGPSRHSSVFIDYLKSMISDEFAVIVVAVPQVRNNFLKKKLKISVDVFIKNLINKHTITLYGSRKEKAITKSDFPDRWYKKSSTNIPKIYREGIADLCLYLSEQPLKKIQKNIWSYITTRKIFLDRFYITYKIRQMLKKPYIPLVGRVKFIKRLFDVVSMMFLLHLWPEQVYRFSTRKLLPSKIRRYHKNNKPIIPYELITSRTSDISKMKEANVVLRGESFDIKKLKELDPPIFLVSFWEPIKIEKDVTYLMGRAKNALRLGKLGLKVIHTEVNKIDYDGKVLIGDGNQENSWYEQFINDGTCKRISMLEKIYSFPEYPSPLWAPIGSALPAICALSYFAEKVNVYGWDFYLESSPDVMNYWKLYSNLYKLKLDVFRSRNHLESAIINFYYGYQLSKLPNFNIQGYLGQLGKHQKLIDRLERVLFNS